MFGLENPQLGILMLILFIFAILLGYLSPSH
jgi:hypothetical protein